MATQGQKRTVKIIDCKPVYHGTNVKGHEYTIHEIRAAKPDGSLIGEKMRSFTALPIGQAIEVTVVPYSSDQYGKSFTLYPTNEKGTGTTAEVNDLNERYEQLRESHGKLQERVVALERVVGELLRDDARIRNEPADSDTAALDAAFGVDPPFG